ncbi:MAG: aminotransferase class V-fold PLP-dependent enzyme [Pseudomonadales bacterium]
MTIATTRRWFLGAVGAGAALSASRATRAADGDYWELIRAQFAFSEDRIPMNAANLCPSPRSVAERVYQLTYDIDRDCSFQNRSSLTDLLERSRAGVAAALNVSVDEVALVRNTSEANNVVNNGLVLGAGDEVVLWDQNHPTNNVAWDVRAARSGFRVRRVSVPVRPVYEDQLIDPFVDALSDSTRVLALTHVSNVSGIRLPIAEIAARARRRGVHVHVDGAQTWGALDVDLAALGCDTYTASAHKWFMGPKEAGLLYVRSDRIEQLWPSIVAPGWGEDAESDLVGARKFESLGQRDDACLAAIADASRLHAAIGAARVEQRVRELSQRLKSGVAELGLDLVTPMDPALSGGVCIVEVAPGRRGDVWDRLYTEHGIAGAPTGGLRLCPHVYNTTAHVDRALAGIRALLVG